MQYQLSSASAPSRQLSQSFFSKQNSIVRQKSPVRLGRLALRALTVIMVVALSGCGQSQDSAALDQTESSLVSATWRPFTKDSVWNLQLPAQHSETALPAAGLAVAPMAISDGDYGIKIYFGSASAPTWTISFDDFNSVTDNWSQTAPLTLQAPAAMVPPDGSDGTVILVDRSRKYVYEMWQFSVTSAAGSSSPTAHCASMNVSDLRSSGIHRNVGITAAGLPGVGGVLRAAELTATTPIRHKLWLALHSALLLDQASWPASQTDGQASGKYAAVGYGDVMALAKSFDVEAGKCQLSPLMKRLAHALQDFGGIVQDRGGDSVGVVAEVGAFADHMDTSESTMWTQLACLRQYLVKVDAPWTNATQGGLGY